MALQCCNSFINNIFKQKYLSKCLLRAEVIGHYGYIRNNSKSLGREARFMKKIMGRKEIKKKFQVFDQVPSTTIASKQSKVKTTKTDSRRMTVLNKLFMEKITGIVATGSLHYDLVDKGVLITKVQISPDFNTLNVFWFSPTLTEDIDNLLNGIAAKLHHELTQLQLMGFVPNVKFVKDKDKIRLMEVDKLLKSISAELENIDYDNEKTDDQNLDDEKLPDMTTDVYGLQHDVIMKKIGFSMTTKSDFINSLKEQDSSK